MSKISIKKNNLTENLPENISRMILLKQPNNDKTILIFYKFLIIYIIAQCTTAFLKTCGGLVVR